MRSRHWVPVLVMAVVALMVTVPSLLHAHQEQKAKPEPNQTPKMMGQGMMGQGTKTQGMMDQGMMDHDMMGQEMPMMPGMQRLMMPQMDPVRGRKLFASKGCVACHAINGVGGHDATPLDAHTMDRVMNPFDFAAKMWRMAPAMIYAQEEALGEQILFTGDELADIIAFIHHDEEQHRFSEADITPEVRKMMDHSHGEPGGGAEMHKEELGHRHGEGKKDDHN